MNRKEWFIAITTTLFWCLVALSKNAFLEIRQEMSVRKKWQNRNRVVLN